MTSAACRLSSTEECYPPAWLRLQHVLYVNIFKLYYRYKMPKVNLTLAIKWHMVKGIFPPSVTQRAHEVQICEYDNIKIEQHLKGPNIKGSGWINTAGITWSFLFKVRWNSSRCSLKHMRSIPIKLKTDFNQCHTSHSDNYTHGGKLLLCGY